MPNFIAGKVTEVLKGFAREDAELLRKCYDPTNPNDPLRHRYLDRVERSNGTEHDAMTKAMRGIGWGRPSDGFAQVGNVRYERATRSIDKATRSIAETVAKAALTPRPRSSRVRDLAGYE